MTFLPVDYSLYLVTDRSLSQGRSTARIVRAAVDGGAGMVQLREKEATTRDFVAEALSIRDFLRSRGIPLIINDRLDVALAVGADGVHLGQNDMPLQMARRIANDRMLIGISAESLEDAVAAQKGGADYIGVSPVFATPTKTDTAPPLGFAGLERIRQHIKIPLVGIGGISAVNAGQVIQSGADGVAVVSAVVAAEDPRAAARMLKQTIERARRT